MGVSENIFIEDEGELMLKIYDKEVFIIDMEEFQTDAVQMLENIIENPDYDKMVFLLRKRKKVICAANLQKILSNNLIPKVFAENGGYLRMRENFAQRIRCRLIHIFQF